MKNKVLLTPKAVQLWNDLLAYSKTVGKTFQATMKELLTVIPSINNKNTLTICLHQLDDCGYIEYNASRGRTPSTITIKYTNELSKESLPSRNVKNQKNLDAIEFQLEQLEKKKDAYIAQRKETSKFIQKMVMKGGINAEEAFRLKKKIQRIMSLPSVGSGNAPS